MRACRYRFFFFFFFARPATRKCYVLEPLRNDISCVPVAVSVPMHVGKSSFFRPLRIDNPGRNEKKPLQQG